MEMTPPTDEHRWLQRLIGNWTSETTCSMGPDQPPSINKSRETVRAIGDYWIAIDTEGEMPDGGPFSMRVQLGYDPELGRFRGTWIGSMMPMLWVYDGALNSERTTLTLKARGPSFAGNGTLADYEDIVELGPDGDRRFRSRVLMPDGTWYQFMHAVY